VSEHTTPDPHTLVGPYVLDALPDDERALFEDHLARCPECRAEADELRAAAGHLGRAAAVVPPAALRDQVLAAVEVTRQQPPGAPPGTARRRTWPLVLATAATIAVVVALGALLLQADHRADRAEQVAAVVAAPDARTVPIAGEGGSMRLVVSSAHDSAVLLAEGMAAPPPGKTYALWYQQGGRMVPAGLFEPGADGAVRQRVEGVPPDVVGVTVEPDGGSDEPTLPVIASGTA
jgi:anti-sigma factor RsiW